MVSFPPVSPARPYVHSKTERWFLRLAKILWEPVTESPFSSITISRMVTLISHWFRHTRLTVSSSSFLDCRYSFLLFLKPLLGLTLFRLYTLLWFGSCNPCILACFLCSKKSKHSSPNHGLCCFSSYRAGLSTRGLLFSLMLSQAPFYHLRSPKLQTCLRT